jgi:predicted transcriptional regulator
MMGSKAVKLDDETYARLKALGEARKRSPHWLMKEAIQQFLDREEEAEHIRRDTLKRWERYETTGEMVTHDVVDAWIETRGTKGEGKCPVPRMIDL